MELRMLFQHLGPSVPHMGLNHSQMLDPFCGRVSMVGSSPVTAPGSQFYARSGCPQRSVVQPHASEAKRGNLHTFEDGHVLPMKQRMSRGHSQGVKTLKGKTKIRSFVDEFTAQSSDLFMEEEGEADLEEDEIKEPFLDSVAEFVVIDNALDQSSYGEQDLLNEVARENDSESQLSDTEDFSLEDADYKYEDMKFGQEKNWSLSDVKKVDVLRNFEYRHKSEIGTFVVQAMRVDHMKATEELLVDSFAELMGGLLTYRPLLALTVRQYVRERISHLPYAVTLVGLFSPSKSRKLESENVENVDPDNADEEASQDWTLTGTVELSFSDVGLPGIPAGPAPPPGSPYLCNMAVSTANRRQGLGKQLLKAAEELTVLMGAEDLYLHCRIVDVAPLNMYRGAGFKIVATDSILSLLSFQRRRHLMCKKLALPTPP